MRPIEIGYIDTDTNMPIIDGDNYLPLPAVLIESNKFSGITTLFVKNNTNMYMRNVTLSHIDGPQLYWSQDIQLLPSSLCATDLIIESIPPHSKSIFYIGHYGDVDKILSTLSGIISNILISYSFVNVDPIGLDMHFKPLRYLKSNLHEETINDNVINLEGGNPVLPMLLGDEYVQMTGKVTVTNGSASTNDSTVIFHFKSGLTSSLELYVGTLTIMFQEIDGIRKLKVYEYMDTDDQLEDESIQSIDISGDSILSIMFDGNTGKFNFTWNGKPLDMVYNSLDGLEGSHCNNLIEIMYPSFVYESGNWPVLSSITIYDKLKSLSDIHGIYTRLIHG